MMNKIWFWLYLRMRRARDMETMKNMQAEGVTAAKGPSFQDGTHFHLHDAENGKVLQVFITGQKARSQLVGGFNPHGNQEQKTWVIPEGENVIEFITRALVEERLK